MITLNRSPKMLILLLILMVSGIFAWAEIKVGVINPQKVIENTIKGKEFLARMKKLSDTKQAQVTEMQKEIDKLQNELMSPALSNEAKEAKGLQLNDKRTKLNRYVEDSRQEMQYKYNKEMEVLQKDIMPLIKKIGESKGFTIIFDIGTAGISYFDQQLDISDLIISEYNSQQKSNK